MGFWSFIAAPLGVVAGVVALTTPIGWVAGVVAALGAAVTSVDLMNRKARLDAEEAERLAEKKIKALIAMGDSEAQFDLERMLALCDEVEKKQELLAKDKVPAGKEKETKEAIEKGITELRIGIIAWTSADNPHRDKYANVIGKLINRVNSVSVAYERLTTAALSNALQESLKILNASGEKLKNLSEKEGAFLSDKGKLLLHRINNEVESEEERNNLNEIIELIGKANASLKSIPALIEKSKKGVEDKNEDDALKYQINAEKAKDEADKCILKLLPLIAKLKGSTPPDVFKDISDLFIRSAKNQDTVHNNIQGVVAALLGDGVRRIKGVSHNQVNEVAHAFINRAKEHYDEYNKCKPDSNKASEARRNAEYANAYLAYAKEWMSHVTSDDEDATFAWSGTTARINCAEWFGNTFKGALGGSDTAAIRKELRALYPKIAAADHLSKIEHESRFRQEMDLAFVVIGDNVRMTAEINDEIASVAKASAEAQRVREAEEKAKAEQEARAKADKEAKAKAEQEAKDKADKEIQRLKAEQERASKAAEAQRIRDAEEKAKAEKEIQRLKAEQERVSKAAEAQRIRDAEEKDKADKEIQRLKAEQERASKAAEAQRIRDAEEKAKADKEIQAAKERLAKDKAEQDTPYKEIQRLKAEQERASKEAEAKAKADKEARDKEIQRLKAEQEAKDKAKQQEDLKERTDALLSKPRVRDKEPIAAPNITSDTRRSVMAKEEQKEKEEAIGVDISEGAYTAIKPTKEEKQARSLLDKLQVEKDLRIRDDAIRELQKKSREALKEWSGLTDEALRQRFIAYADVFYQGYSLSDGKFRGSKKATEELDKLLESDPGLVRVHSFLTEWSPLGLVYDPEKPRSEKDEATLKLDVLFRLCLTALRENKIICDEMLSLADKGKKSANSYYFEVLANKQRDKAIGIGNYIKEILVLNEKVTGDTLSKSQSYIALIRSELQGINSTVAKIKNELKILGITIFGETDTPPTYAIIPNSSSILKEDFKFEALSDLQSIREYDSKYTQLFDMFLEDFRTNIASELARVEDEEFKEGRSFSDIKSTYTKAISEHEEHLGDLDSEIEELEKGRNEALERGASPEEKASYDSRFKSQLDPLKTERDRIAFALKQARDDLSKESDRYVERTKSLLGKEKSESESAKEQNLDQAKLKNEKPDKSAMERLDKRIAFATDALQTLNEDNVDNILIELKKSIAEDERLDTGSDRARITRVLEDVKKLSPLSSVSKIIAKETGDPAFALDYDKVGFGESVLSDTLEERFKSLTTFKKWIKVSVPERQDTPYQPLPLISSDVAWKKRDTEEALKDIRFNDALKNIDKGSQVARSPDGSVRPLGQGEKLKAGETIGWADERIVHIPCMDTGDVFNGTMGKKRRIFKVAVRVIDTADLEVGIKGFPLMPVEELIGKPRTGEFETLVPSDASLNPEIVISQKTGAPFCLTSITAHMQIEG